MAVLVGVMIVVLMGIGGLVADIGRMYIVKTGLQSAMDACALAAAAQLSDDVNALDRAAAHGRAMVDPTKTAPGQSRAPRYVNSVFQTGPIDPSLVQVEFSTTLAGPYVLPGGLVTPTNAKFVRCLYTETNVPTYLLQVLNLMPASASIPALASVQALAVATQEPSSSVSCGFPIAMCKTTGTSASSSPHPFGLVPGNWYASVAGPLGPGAFGWIDYSPNVSTPGCSGTGADELACIIEGPGVCSLTTGIPVGETGVNASLERAWNTRFGIYSNGVGHANAATAAPDFTGVGYSSLSSWPAGNNAYGNYQSQLNSRRPYNDAGSGLPQIPESEIRIHPSSPSESGVHVASGAKRRIVTAPIVDCSGFSGGTFPNIEAFACILLLRPINLPGQTQIEYLGLASAAGTPCVTGGLPGGSIGPLVTGLVQ